MPLTRRQFLASTAALAVVPKASLASKTPVIEATTGRAQLIDAEFGDYPETEIWGYNGSVPGPLLRFKQGDTLKQELLNSLPSPTAIHWHGIRVPNAMDGVPGMTQDAVPTGDSFHYEFPLKDAGTYWYHSHNQSTEQVARGLYGVVVVEETNAPDVDHDIVVILDDWRLSDEAQITDDFGAMHDWTHAGRLGNYIHAQLSEQPDSVPENARLRLRFVNVAIDRVITVSIQGGDGNLVARDGMPLEIPEPLDAMPLGPAERADVIINAQANEANALQIVLHEGDTGYLLKEIPISGSQPARDAIQPLPANPMPRLSDLSGGLTVPLHMEGGAMGGLREATYEGEKLDIRGLVDKGQVWAFNGQAGLSDTPLVEVDQGQIVRIPMQNDTSFAHAMHLHGTHFQEVLPDGSFGPLKDTILMQPRETREIAFIAGAPGKWLMHCHMLSHAAAGMRTWIKVV